LGDDDGPEFLGVEGYPASEITARMSGPVLAFLTAAIAR